MTDVLGAVIRGLSFGSVYAVLAVGLVLTYRTTGVFNLAFGPQAFFAAALFYDLQTSHHWPIWLALIVSVGITAPIVGFVLDRGLFRFLRTASESARARVGARPVRRVTADDLPVVRPEREGERIRHRARRLGLVQPDSQRVRHPRRPRDHHHRARHLRRPDRHAPVHRPRSAHAGGGRERPADRARGRELRPGEHRVVDAVERARRASPVCS